MATHEFDCAWCGKHVVMKDYRGQPPKYCSEKCRRDVSAIKKREHRERERLKHLYCYTAPPVQTQDLTPVPITKCVKCAYSLLVGREICCDYWEATGNSRVAMHTEGLTADCREFKPRARSRKKIPIKVNG